MSELDLETIEKIVQHTAKTVSHGTAPETRQLIKDLDTKFEEHKLDDLRIIEMLEQQNHESKSFSAKVDAHMERVEPVISAYEDSKRLQSDIESIGNRIAFWAKVTTSLGVLGVAIKYAISGLNIKI